MDEFASMAGQRHERRIGGRVEHVLLRSEPEIEKWEAKLAREHNQCCHACTDIGDREQGTMYFEYVG